MAAFVCFAKIVSVHGVKGKVKAISQTDRPEVILQMGEALAKQGSRETRLHISEATFSGKFFIFHFEEIGSLEKARLLVGAELLSLRDDLGRVSEMRYPISRLEGARVEDETGSFLGSLENIYATGANDVYEIKPKNGPSYLVPAIQEVVRLIDIDNKKIILRLLRGLGPEIEKEP